jgi:hypothetical protein
MADRSGALFATIGDTTVPAPVFKGWFSGSQFSGVSEDVSVAETIPSNVFIPRYTKMDNVLRRLPNLYASSPGSNLRTLLHAITREDDRVGGTQLEGLSLIRPEEE